MTFLLDTNIFIHLRDGLGAARMRFAQHQGSIVLSSLSLAELQRGLDPRLPDAAIRRTRHDLLLPLVAVLPFDSAAAEAYGKIVWYKGRTKSRDIDHLIAAHAISTASVLVTNNEADFANIPGLAVENWTV